MNTNLWLHESNEPTKWHFFGGPAPQRITTPRPTDPLLEKWGFYFWPLNPRGLAIGAPHWFLVAISAIAAVYFAYRLSWRISMRSAMIVFTLVTLGMGLIVSLRS